MKKNQTNNLLKKIIFSNFILIICLFLIIFFSSSLIRDFLNKKQLLKEVSRLQSEISELTQKNDKITNLITYLESVDYLEEEARVKLNKKKPEENIIIITENLHSLATTTIIDYQKSLEINANIHGSNIKNWWQYLFSKNI